MILNYAQMKIKSYSVKRTSLYMHVRRYIPEFRKEVRIRRSLGFASYNPAPSNEAS